ncbi:MAG: zinc-binding alcohol dehydrogenase family protein [Methylococcaceae bacterium]|nr:MAG: zinc-binding alcohol dehydrogenase family protein [Methylococcaceae bacterium]
MKVIAIDSRQQWVELELPTPEPGPGDLLVRIEAVAVNPIDTKLRGSVAAGAAPKVLGWDAAGVVLAVGEAVTGFQPGDEVFYAGDVLRPGCNAELQLVDARLAAHKPATLGFAEAAALPLTGLTAWESLFERLGICAEGTDQDRCLLIIGAAGGVGSMAIQLAKQVAGLNVIATASRPESLAWCRDLGADVCLDHAGDWIADMRAGGLRYVDYVLNCNSVDAYWDAMAEAVKPQGIVCCLASAIQPLDLNRFKNKSVRIAWEFMFTKAMYQTDDMASQGEILKQLADLVDIGITRSTLTDCLGPLSPANLSLAHARIEQGHTIGKLALTGMGATA